MSNFSNISSEEQSNALPPSIDIPISIQIWTYIVFDILSIFCSLFTLYYLLFEKTLRHALNNHVIIVLLFMGLIYELTSIPWLIHHISYGSPWIQTTTFYLFSFFFDYGIYATQIALFAWATVERHILIFHDQWISTQKKRLYIHYLPILVILIYCFIYYLLVTFAPFCQNYFEAFIAVGVYIPCVFNKTILGTWDLLFHQVIPTILIVICSIALIIRVIRQKRKVNLPIQWRKHRKMTIQMISISVLYLIFNCPWTILIFASQYGLPDSMIMIPMIYAVYLRNYLIFLFPFVCCGSLSEVRGKIKQLFRFIRRNQILPEGTLEMRRTAGR